MLMWTYLEAKDDGPDEAECKTMVAINNIMRTNVLQVNSLFFKELQGFVHIFQAVDSHSSSRRARLMGGEVKRRVNCQRHAVLGRSLGYMQWKYYLHSKTMTFTSILYIIKSVNSL